MYISYFNKVTDYISYKCFNPQLLNMNKKTRFSDSDLVEAIREKDMLEQAIFATLPGSRRITRSFIMGKGGTEQDADDIFQETIVSFIDIVQKGKFRQESCIRNLPDFHIKKSLV